MKKMTAALAACMIACLAACGSTPPIQSQAKQPDPVEQLYKKAHKHIEQNELAKAQPMLEEVLSKQPDHPRALFDRAMLRMVQGRLADARVDMDRALSLAPKDIRILGGMCVLIVAQSQAEHGLRFCEDAVGIGLDADPNALSSRGQARLMLGRYQEAVADFDVALSHNPRHARSIYGRGLALERMGREAEGRRAMDHALAILPGAAREYISDMPR